MLCIFADPLYTVPTSHKPAGVPVFAAQDLFPTHACLLSPVPKALMGRGCEAAVAGSRDETWMVLLSGLSAGCVSLSGKAVCPAPRTAEQGPGCEKLLRVCECDMEGPAVGGHRGRPQGLRQGVSS